MRSRYEIRKTLSSANRLVIGVNSVLTALLLLFATLPLFMPASSLITGLPDGEDKSYTDVVGPITVAAVRDATTGRAIFRTYRKKEARVIDELSHYVLSGTSVRDGTMRAYVRDTKLNSVAIKKVGDMLGPYEVVDIEKEGLELRRGGETVLLPKG